MAVPDVTSYFTELVHSHEETRLPVINLVQIFLEHPSLVAS